MPTAPNNHPRSHNLKLPFGITAVRDFGATAFTRHPVALTFHEKDNFATADWNPYVGEMETTDLNIVSSELPSTCLQCGYQTVLNTIPLQKAPIDLVRSYYLPSSTDRSAIEANISSSETSIKTLEAEISKLQTAVKLMQSRRENIQQYADSNRALLSPWRRLPDEVLGNIFFYACDSAVNVLSRSGEIWVLQQVCTRWRSVVQSTPFLWNEILALAEDSSALRRQSVVLRRTEMCAKLSKSGPLTVASFRNHKTRLVGEVHETFLKVLATQAHRWRCLYLDKHSSLRLVGGPQCTVPLVQPGELRSLRVLALEGFFDVVGFRIFEGASALEEVSLRFCILPEVSAFPWSNLKRLSLTGCLLRTGSKVLYGAELLFSALHNVEKLHLGSNDLYIKQILTPITLPSLREASIELSLYSLQVISMLRVPRLVALKVVDGEGNPILNPGPLISMIQMSGCKIKKLHLKMEKPAAILQILREASQYVEQLSLANTSLIQDNDDILSGLEWRPAEGFAILPLLRELTVQPFGYKLLEEDLVDLYILCVRRIVHSRSAFLSPDMAESDKSPSVSLSFVTCSIEVEPTEAHEVDVCHLEQFGEDRGVRIEFAFEGEIEETNDFEDSWAYSEYY